MREVAVRVSVASCFLAMVMCSVPQVTAQETSPDRGYRLQVGTQLVLLDVSVESKRTGKPLLGLSATDFEVTEDGRPQNVSSVSQDAFPLSLLFPFDLTDTVHPVLQHLADGAAEVLRHLRPEDEVAVMTFSSHAKLEQRFTRDRMTAVEGIDAASASYERSEPTFLFEDLWQAVQVSESSRLKDARRVQIWVTDGSANDQEGQRGLARAAPGTLHGEQEAADALLRSGVVVSALVERSGVQASGRFGDVERYAALTGGPVVYATAADAAVRFASLLDTLRARYTLGYKPAEVKPNGTVCRLKVGLSASFFTAHPELRPKDLLVRSRGSYMRAAAAER